MSGRILQAMMMVLTCYVAGQKPGAVAAEADSSDLENRLERLEAIYERNTQKQNEINNQQADQLENQAVVTAEQSARIASLELENQNQARVITEQGERITELKLEHRQQDNIVAFTASASQTRSYNQGDPVLFDSVLTNYGDSYDGLTSIFTCSVSGYYLFSMTVMTDDNNMRAQMQLDDTPLVTAYSTDWETGSNLVVIHCVEGQRVWVMCLQGQGEVMYGGGSRWSTFSGTLLTLG